MAILAISPGWKESTPPKFSQIWLPFTSLPTRGKSGESSSAKPTIMRVYL